MSPERLVHHELCFGCGQTNLFGLLMEVEDAGDGRVGGRGFVKQDHQGATRGSAHEGILTAALSEAMALACGLEMRATWLELRLHRPVPVGRFIEVEAEVEEESGDALHAVGTARVEGEVVATARGTYEPIEES